jgi:hypothetical protein
MLLAVPMTAAAAPSCRATSGAVVRPLVELYASAGSDSCPPADRWVTQLPGKKLAADRLLTLAFHVDYWNQLGWRDAFSQATFSERQREQSRRRAVGFVVTPQLLLNGRDYRRGVLFDDMQIPDGGTLDPSRVLQPKAEAEIAIIFGQDLHDVDATAATVAAATEYAVAAIEIVDSRIADWKISFADTVADNGSSAFYVLGRERSVGEFARSFSLPDPVDHENVKASMKNGILSIVVPKMQKSKTQKRVQITAE